MAATALAFDLQSHSTESDGALAPEAVVAAAAAAGVELLSLTDHDTIDGVAAASAAARAAGMRLVTGVEISALDRDGRDLHILGYGFDAEQPGLRERLRYFRGDRERRAERIASALRELGFELDDALLQSRVAAGKSIGRPHLAQAVVGHPANAARLADEDVSEPTAFLVAYLIEGRPAFRARESPTVPEAIDAIHSAGGVAVWAHPFWDVSEPAAVAASVDRFHSIGIDGIECFYVTHTREQTERLARQCERLGLLSTGSSDFHGPEHRQFSRFRTFETYGLEPMLGPIAA